MEFACYPVGFETLTALSRGLTAQPDRHWPTACDQREYEMRKGAKLLVAGALCGAMAGCAALDPRAMDDFDLYKWDLDSAREMTPQGAPFIHGLRVGYLALHDEEYEDYDWTDADHFARKAVESARGLNVRPDMVSLRELTPDHVDELTAARARLMAGLEGGGRQKAPFAAARAQVAYDCWLEQQEENDVDDIARCKEAFEKAMAEVEDALASDIDNVYIVFFNWDKATITPVAQKTIDQVASDFAEGRVTRIVLAGHTDTSGPASYNEGLSERRARAVAAALAAKGVDDNSLDINWYGETQPRVATPDGVREPQNRRVEITFME